jgi:hypothetical protein
VTYNKRQKGGWNGGKANKGNRKAREREYVKKDIKQQIDEQDPEYRVHYNKRTPNRKARLEYEVGFYERLIKKYKDNKINSRFANWFRDSLRKAKKKLKELNENKDN